MLILALLSVIVFAFLFTAKDAREMLEQEIPVLEERIAQVQPQANDQMELPSPDGAPDGESVMEEDRPEIGHLLSFPEFRLCALSGLGKEVVSAGIEIPGSGRTHLLRLGETAPGGWAFVRGDLDMQTAVFEKDGMEHVLRLEAGSRRLTAENVISPKMDAKAAVPSGVQPTAAAAHKEVPVFQDRVIKMDNLGPVDIQQDKVHPEWVQVKADQSQFVLRREIVDSILKIDRVDEQQHAWMLLSHPLLVEVLPGEDAIRAALNAETELSEIIGNPPTNTPPLDELNRLIREQGENHP